MFWGVDKKTKAPIRRRQMLFRSVIMKDCLRRTHIYVYTYTLRPLFFPTR